MKLTPRRVLLAAGVVAGLGFAGTLAYYQLVKAGVLRYNQYDRRERGTLAVGQTPPDLELAGIDGTRFRLSTLWAGKPVLLVFGSCT